MFNLLSHFFCSVNFKDQKKISEILKFEGIIKSENLLTNSFFNAISIGESSIDKSIFKNNEFEKNKYISEFSEKFKKGLLGVKYLKELEFEMKEVLDDLVKRKNISIFLNSEGKNEKYLEKRVFILLRELKSRFPKFLEGENIENENNKENENDLKYEIENNLEIENNDNNLENVNDNNLVEKIKIEKDENKFEKKYLKKYYVIPSYNNYVTETFEIPNFFEKDFAILNLISKLKSNINGRIFFTKKLQKKFHNKMFYKNNKKPNINFLY